ncbi:hypothetical protein GCM10027562_08500 [Arthrobacter pigmenti]
MAVSATGCPDEHGHIRQRFFGQDVEERFEQAAVAGIKRRANRDQTITIVDRTGQGLLNDLLRGPDRKGGVWAVKSSREGPWP